jgi:hypothetical protein
MHVLQSIPSVSSPLHFPPCLWIFFSHLPLLSPQFLAPLSPILPLKSPPKILHSSLFSFIVSSTPLIVVFISLLYIVIIFTTYCLYVYMFLSIHPSSSPFSLIPNFTHVIIFRSSSFLLFPFWPLTFLFLELLFLF